MESMAHSFIITQDLPDPGLLPQVVRLFYEAFALKIHHLELFARDRAQAERLLANSFRPELGLFAHRGVELGGLLGLEYARGPRFFGVRYPILRAEFGAAGALWRWGWLTLSHLYQRPRPGEMRIEAVVVAEAARGQGTGTALLDLACSHARARGCSALTLEVVDSNPRARQLYERLGFVARKEERYGAVTARAGFRGVAFMRKVL